MYCLRLKISFFIVLLILIQSHEASKLEDLFSQLTNIIKLQRLPKYLKICPRNEDVNHCIGESIENIKLMLIKGIPEFGIPSCEPVHLPEITMNQGSGKSFLQSHYRNIELSGVSQFTLRSVNLNMTKLRLKFWIPELQMKSNYAFTGHILSQAIFSKGIHRGNYSDIDVVIEMNLKNSNVTEVLAKIIIGHGEVHFSNPFEGYLGLNMNEFLNEKWRYFAEEIRPVLEKMIANVIKTYANRIFNKYPVDLLLPEN